MSFRAEANIIFPIKYLKENSKLFKFIIDNIVEKTDMQLEDFLKILEDESVSNENEDINIILHSKNTVRIQGIDFINGEIDFIESFLKENKIPFDRYSECNEEGVPTVRHYRENNYSLKDFDTNNIFLNHNYKKYLEIDKIKEIIKNSKDYDSLIDNLEKQISDIVPEKKIEEM